MILKNIYALGIIIVFLSISTLISADARILRQVQDNLTDESFAEQQRLLKAKRDFNDRLVELTQVDDFT